MIKRKVSLIWIVLLLLSVTTQSIIAQYRANIWMLSPWDGPLVWPYSAIDFNTGTADTFSVMRNMGFFITNTSICDTSGNLLFYTNGVRINNANHDTLWNSINFNPGYASTINVQQLNIVQGALILPQPGNSNRYYLFHISGEQFTAYGFLQQQPLNLRYSIIDMSLDGGLGGIVPGRKTVSIINDTLLNGGLTACRHGNGRDWWNVMPRFFSNKYYKLLLTSDTLVNHSLQVIGDTLKYDVDVQSVFSPDGSKYAIVTHANNLNLFRFDRCTGLFYDSTFIQVPNPTPGLPDNQAYGLAFSPNSRFLYVVLYTRIIQYDTWAADIASSQTYVAEWDTFYNPFATYFLTAQLAPDNKIYIGTYGATYVLHYINNPDSLGLACDVIQNSFVLPNDNFTVPTFPNYDLGRWAGSPCDTLTGLEESQKENYLIKIFPNPAQNHFFINYEIMPHEQAQFILYDCFGREVERKTLYGSFKTLMVHTGNLGNGVYFYSIRQKEKAMASGKIVIIH